MRGKTLDVSQAPATINLNQNAKNMTSDMRIRLQKSGVFISSAGLVECALMNFQNSFEENLDDIKKYVLEKKFG